MNPRFVLILQTILAGGVRLPDEALEFPVLALGPERFKCIGCDDAEGLYWLMFYGYCGPVAGTSVGLTEKGILAIYEPPIICPAHATPVAPPQRWAKGWSESKH